VIASNQERARDSLTKTQENIMAGKHTKDTARVQYTHLHREMVKSVRQVRDDYRAEGNGYFYDVYNGGYANTFRVSAFTTWFLMVLATVGLLRTQSPSKEYLVREYVMNRRFSRSAWRYTSNAARGAFDAWDNWMGEFNLRLV
jgi:hypothetical protein